MYDTYSKRKKRAEKGNEPDTFTYDSFPQHLRYQLALIFNEFVGPYIDPVALFIGGNSPNANRFWEFIHKTMMREVKGFYSYDISCENRDHTPQKKCINFLENYSNVDELLDFVEIICRTIQDYVKAYPEESIKQRGATKRAEDAIDEINRRFNEHKVGYQIENGNIVRVDNLYLHSEAVKPALVLLNEKEFNKANQDFQEAHEHYRHGRYKDCVVGGLRAFESALKAICANFNWEYSAGARATDLIKIIRKNGLFEHDLGSGFDTYIAMMKTGLPNVRNQAGGHGSDPNDPEIHEYLAAYAIHLTATNIVMLCRAFIAMKNKSS